MISNLSIYPDSVRTACKNNSNHSSQYFNVLDTYIFSTIHITTEQLQWSVYWDSVKHHHSMKYLNEICVSFAYHNGIWDRSHVTTLKQWRTTFSKHSHVWHGFYFIREKPFKINPRSSTFKYSRSSKNLEYLPAHFISLINALFH